MDSLSGFDRPAAHIAMLDDRARTDAFLAAIAEMVRPGDVVVDIGTGTGVLAVAAARAGARHVYAIEVGHIADAAEALVRENGYADRITVMRGRSTRIDLPERANILLSETIGNDPLDEGIVKTIRDGRARFLAPDARIIPRTLSVRALPVDLGADFVEEHRFDVASLERWKKAYGIEFGSLARYAADDTRVGSVLPDNAARWAVVGEPLELVNLDLTTTSSTSVSGEGEVAITRAATHLGFVIYFEAELSPKVNLTTDPGKTTTTSWKSPVFYAAGRPCVAVGDRVSVGWTWRAGQSAMTVR